MLSWGQLAWTFFTLLLYIGKLLSERLGNCFSERLWQFSCSQWQKTLENREYLILNFDRCELLFSFSLKILSPTHCLFTRIRQLVNANTSHFAKQLFSFFVKHFYIFLILLTPVRNRTWYYNPLCKWGPEKLNDFSKGSWSGDTSNEIKTKFTYLSSPMFFAHGGFPLRRPFGLNICSDSDLVHLGVPVISEHFQDVWESNENDRSSSQQKGHIYAHAQKVKVLAPQSCPTLFDPVDCRQRNQIKLPTSARPSKKQKCCRKSSNFALLTMPKPLTVWITTNCGKFFKRWEYQTTWPASWEICMQVRKQQLELDMEQQTGSKLVKTVYCHPASLTYMQSTSCEMPG